MGRRSAVNADTPRARLKTGRATSPIPHGTPDVKRSRDTVLLGAREAMGRVAVLASVTCPSPCLSTQEKLVLAHAAAGFTDREMARTLNVSIGCIRYSIRTAMAQLGARSRTQAVARAIASRMVVAGDSVSQPEGP